MVTALLITGCLTLGLLVLPLLDEAVRDRLRGPDHRTLGGGRWL